jgi:3-mercaptopyruvate sulfurtransferase SseA
MDLKKIGIIKVRPLQGGLKAWQDQGYPLDNFFPEEMAKAAS